MGVGKMEVGGYGWGTPPLGEDMLPYMGGDLWQRPLALTNADNDPGQHHQPPRSTFDPEECIFWPVPGGN